MQLVVMLILMAAVGAIILWPLFRPDARIAEGPPAPVPPGDTSRSRTALNALKELEFDYATGKIADDDYRILKARYEARAVEALTQPSAPVPPPALDARLEAEIRAARGRRFCASCGGPLPRAAKFCPACGAAAAEVRS